MLFTIDFITVIIDIYSMDKESSISNEQKPLGQNINLIG